MADARFIPVVKAFVTRFPFILPRRQKIFGVVVSVVFFRRSSLLRAAKQALERLLLDNIAVPSGLKQLEANETFANIDSAMWCVQADVGFQMLVLDGFGHLRLGCTSKLQPSSRARRALFIAKR